MNSGEVDYDEIEQILNRNKKKTFKPTGSHSINANVASKKKNFSSNSSVVNVSPKKKKASSSTKNKSRDRDNDDLDSNAAHMYDGDEDHKGSFAFKNVKNLHNTLEEIEAEDELIKHNKQQYEKLIGEEEVLEENEAKDLIENQFLEQKKSIKDNIEHTRQIKNKYFSSYIPFDHHNICIKNISIELCGRIDGQPIKEVDIDDSFKDILNDKKKMTYLQWVPDEPIKYFGSRKDYCQGFYVPPVDANTGNLNNVFIEEVNVSNLKNDFPFAIGVKLGEQISPNEWIPFKGATYVHNKQEYHFIIPANSTNFSTSFSIYRNTSEVNHPIGSEYPHVVPNKESLEKQVKAYGDNQRLIHKRSIIIKFIYENAHIYNWPLPGTDNNEKYKNYCVVNTSQANKAIQKIIEYVEQHLPITNLERLTVRNYYLNDTEFANYSLKQHKLNFKGVLKSKDNNNNSSSSLKVNVSETDAESLKYLSMNAGLNYNLQFIYSFRDNVKDFIDAEDEEDDEDNYNDDNRSTRFSLRG